MEDINIDEFAQQLFENISNMSADEAKELMINYQSKSIESIKNEFEKNKEIYKFLENKDYDFLEKTIIASLVMIRYIVKGNELNDGSRNIK